MKLDNQGISARLEELLAEKKHKSVRAFALSISEDPSFFAKVLKGEKPITVRMIQSVEAEFNVNREWLLFGRGEKYRPPAPNETDEWRDKYIKSLEFQVKYLQDRLNEIEECREILSNVMDLYKKHSVELLHVQAVAYTSMYQLAEHRSVTEKTDKKAILKKIDSFLKQRIEKPGMKVGDE